MRSNASIRAEVEEMLARAARRRAGTSTPGDMAFEIADEIESAADELDTVGVDMDEYDDMGWSAEYRDRIGRVMDRIEEAVTQLHRARDEMKEIAVEMRTQEMST